ncbi:GNAT family N-acetyltransferase [Aerococcaceae bacterium NML160702]|nr:GNAT family N-acetyltransferase [Aerococcaceae bacterium NML190938]MCW6681495.1 GNAT family N-acetyltransferase [Aerococcaceae bacterium NML160702]
MVEAEERLVLGNQDWLRASACYVRMNVFVLERNIAIEDEFDHLDTPNRVYAVLFVGKEPVATGRFVQESDEMARLTRIATLAHARGKGYGRQIIQALEQYAQTEGIRRIVIHSELTAKTFYELLGYQTCSDVYEEDGELCQSLEKLI